MIIIPKRMDQALGVVGPGAFGRLEVIMTTIIIMIILVVISITDINISITSIVTTIIVEFTLPPEVHLSGISRIRFSPFCESCPNSFEKCMA